MQLRDDDDDQEGAHFVQDFHETIRSLRLTIMQLGKLASWFKDGLKKGNQTRKSDIHTSCHIVKKQFNLILVTNK